MNVLLARACVLSACLCAIGGCTGNTIEAYPEQLAGIGVVVKANRGEHVVQKVIEGGPAAQAGLVVGTVIIGIDGTPTKGRSLAAVVDHLRGQDGTQVELRVKGPDGVATIKVKRRMLARVEGKAYQTQ